MLAKNVGKARHFQRLGPDVWWEISQIYIEYIKPTRQMSDELWKFFTFTEEIVKIKSLWLCDAICQHRSGSTLAQVMAGCLTAPSLHLNWCWVITKGPLWHLSDGSFTLHFLTAVSHAFSHVVLINFISNMCSEIILSKLPPHQPVANESTHKQLETHGCILSTVATDVLVPMHQAISIHSADQIFTVMSLIHTEISKL